MLILCINSITTAPYLLLICTLFWIYTHRISMDDYDGMLKIIEGSVNRIED